MSRHLLVSELGAPARSQSPFLPPRGRYSLQDLWFALRLILKDRWFTLVAVTALALGISLNATVFTLVNAVLIRGLPFADSDSLYIVGWLNQSGRPTGASGAELADWREQLRASSALAAWSNTNLTISDDRGLPEQARGAWLTANTFSTLGQKALIGRDFALTKIARARRAW